MEKNKTGKYIIIRYPYGSDTSIERFDTFQELEKAVEDNYTCERVIACQEIEQKLIPPHSALIVN
jgi:hypothetical protein